MSPVPVASHDVSATRPARPASASTTSSSTVATASVPLRELAPGATDDEILEIVAPGRKHKGAETAAAQDRDGQWEFDFDTRTSDAPSAGEEQHAGIDSLSEPENLRPVFDANPELRQAWQDANAYRETFATPEDARAATAQLADLDRLDALFFSHRPEDHAQLARSIASLDPAAFASLAQAMAQLTPRPQARGRDEAERAANAREDASAARNEQRQQSQPRTEKQEHEAPASTQREPSAPNAAQAEFFQAANAEAVQSVLGAIESQVERLLPDGVSKSARNRVVGEIYRELDSALQSNRQFGRQMREAFRSGALDADHQHAIVSLITGRARQALPGVAKRVLSEWASTVIAANHDRRARQRAAEGRVDIVGSGGAGNEGRRSMAPRDIDYARMSDAEILNL